MYSSIAVIRTALRLRTISVKTLQRIAGKCVSFSLAVPAAQLFTREMNAAISKGLRTRKSIPFRGALRDEIAHWLFLEEWDDPLPWRDERHVSVRLATDASQSGWGGTIVTPIQQQTSDYWSPEEMVLDIATKEAMAVDKVLNAFQDSVQNARVDIQVDNQAVINAWQHHGGRSQSLNLVLKKLFFTTTRLNVLLHMAYVSSKENPADEPSRRLSLLDCKLTPLVWANIQRECGGDDGHTCDLMALDSNAMSDKMGNLLPHFTPYPSPASMGVNLFAQDLSCFPHLMQRPYVFPPLVLVGPLLKYLKLHRQSCTVVVLDRYPRKYWWPVLCFYATQAYRVAPRGASDALFRPSTNG